MSWHWKELLPVDRFSVRTSQYVTDIDRLTLTLLYQPLIGAVAHSLYITFLSGLERDQYWCEEQTHRQLMLSLGVPLEVIYEERKKLEAIELLKTFKRQDESGSTYVYELLPPMSPKQFFENDVLSVYLFNRLGKTHYRKLRERFILSGFERESYTELTYAFDEVFSSLHHSEIVSNLNSETGDGLKLERDKELINKPDKTQLTFGHHQFDFELFTNSLSKTIVPEGILTSDVEQAISRLAFVYKIEPLEMSSIVQQALLHDDQLDIDELRKKAQEWYKIEHGSEPPALGLRTQPIKYQTMTGKKPETEEERTIQFYETTPPLTLLEIRSDGAKVPAADAKIVESLIMDHQLLPGVANVLLDFILWSQDMKLSKALVDKIAGHWSRKKVKTVKEAMQLAMLEQKKAKERATKTAQAPSYQKRASSKQREPRRDKLPKWLLAEKKKEQTVNNQEMTKESKVTNEQATKKEVPALSGEKSFEQLLAERRKLKEQKGEE